MGRWIGSSLCESCRSGREVRTATSRFLLCELSRTNAHYPKYAPQPIIRCDGYHPQDDPSPSGRESGTRE